ncbi:hypothetical protein ACIBQX_20690 [Nonomuraea sp. NPDC049714]|uniref:hypothetical protein n=1 Tax=Nonomuraea sp. NPDC049714 TaxID=3364357 RepID=UPI0037B612AA
MTAEEQAGVPAMPVQDFLGCEQLRAQVPAAVVTDRCNLPYFEVHSIEDEPAALPHPGQPVIDPPATWHEDSGS